MSRLKTSWEQLVKHSDELTTKELETLKDKKEKYFKLLRDISLTEEEFHYAEVRQKYNNVILSIEETLRIINMGIKVEESLEESSNELKVIHSELEKHVEETKKLLKEYEDIVYQKWHKEWEVQEKDIIE